MSDVELDCNGNQIQELTLDDVGRVTGGLVFLLLVKPLLELDSQGPGGSYYGNAAQDSANAGFGHVIGMKN